MELAVTIERIELSSDREAWLEMRRNFINASEMATVCGEASYGSLAELYAEKKGSCARRSSRCGHE
jgi:predicted phage-related endonuclease